MKVRVDWTGGMRFVGDTKAGQEIIMEASVTAGGARIGASPMEVVLIGHTAGITTETKVMAAD